MSVRPREGRDQLTQELLEIAAEQSLRQVTEERNSNSGESLHKISLTGLASLDRDFDLAAYSQAEALLAADEATAADGDLTLAELQRALASDSHTA